MDKKMNVLLACVIAAATTLSYAIAEFDWSYHNEGSGSLEWGYLHPDWRTCRLGTLQSPVNIQPEVLLYDPNLTPLILETEGQASGKFMNMGTDLSFFPGSNSTAVYMSGGPLSYNYTLNRIRIHFGSIDSRGSEHVVSNRAFPGEVQLEFYNHQLYSSFKEATREPYGLATISIFLKKTNDTTKTREIEKLVKLTNLHHIVYKDSSIDIENFKILDLLPSTENYVTYEGSTATPECRETVTWIVINKPIEILSFELNSLREIKQTQRSAAESLMMEDNVRPVQPTNGRLMRTNINNRVDKNGTQCSPLTKIKYYKAKL